MRRGFIAAGLLILLFALLLANIRRLDTLIGAVEAGVCRSSAPVMRNSPPRKRRRR